MTTDELIDHLASLFLDDALTVSQLRALATLGDDADRLLQERVDDIIEELMDEE
jgi:hypothetical protein